ncbi:MAG: response regulator transcription factor [Nitrospirota bacterium]|nr:response regulator transcription factor [Nitrospirota bacterium]MDP2383952.1 response regulator transcription factor [Nitrospirota bacterium]MDP3597028.1 response regulator transcription factor [Nitrospirota bacterium]
MLVLIVDDHPLLRQAIRQVIEHHFPTAIVREASTGEEAAGIVRKEPVELAVLDVMLPDHSGLTVLKRIKKLRPQIKCLMLTIHDEPQYVRLALSHGASGYLTKETAPDELHEAIRTVLTGARYVTKGLEREGDARTRLGSLLSPLPILSAREMEVLCLLAKGGTVSRAATQLKLSVKTVSTYRTRLLDKLRLTTTAELIRYAVDRGLVK